MTIGVTGVRNELDDAFVASQLGAYNTGFADDATDLGVALASLSLHYFAWEETVSIVDRVRLALRLGGVLLEAFALPPKWSICYNAISTTAANPDANRHRLDYRCRTSLCGRAEPVVGARHASHIESSTSYIPLSQHHSITDPQRRYTKEAGARWRKP